MTSKRRTPKRGRHLPTIPTEKLFAADPEFARRDEELRARGFAACRTVRIYRRLDGRYSVRVVWRRPDSSVVITEAASYAAVVL